MPTLKLFSNGEREDFDQPLIKATRPPLLISDPLRTLQIFLKDLLHPLGDTAIVHGKIDLLVQGE